MTNINTNELTPALERFSAALERLEQAPLFAKKNHRSRLLDTAERLLRKPGGVEAVYQSAERFDAAGLFEGSDWAFPSRLQPGLVPRTLAEADRWTVTLECLSQLRILAISERKVSRPGFSSEQASHFLKELLALTLEYVFDHHQTEAARVNAAAFQLPRNVLRFVAENIGYDNLLEQLVEEIWRLLRQRPIRIEPVKLMITKLAVYCYDPQHENIMIPAGAERLISSLFSPSPNSLGDPGTAVYAERLTTLDSQALGEEAGACARSMYDTGLVSPYHAVLVRYLVKENPELLVTALGLSSTGVDGLLTYRELVHAIIDKAVHPETSQSILGLSGMLERAVLHFPGVASSLWRQLTLPLTLETQNRLIASCGSEQPPDVYLLAGLLSMLGQPLGVGQGDNPTCQSARALSWWAYSDPDYLLQLLAWAGRDDGVLMTFRGQRISSAFLPAGGAGVVGSDLDPVSMVLVPHLDRVYAEMCRLAHKAGEDPHLHVNPEFHGWQVGGGFAIAVDVAHGKLHEYETFIRLFYACYHPVYNGGNPVIHPQPVGLAMTDSLARFVGWHAITLLRVAIDQTGVTRVYFFNPNNDSGQDLGNGVVVSTNGAGEVYGESSLPIAEFASRLYLFHYDPLEVGDQTRIPAEQVQAVMQLGKESWAAQKIPALDDLIATPPAQLPSTYPK